MTLAVVGQTRIRGHLTKGFKTVWDAFAENFSNRSEVGGGCCIYRQGATVGRIGSVSMASDFAVRRATRSVIFVAISPDSYAVQS